MQDKILVIIPTRDRRRDFKLFADSWLDTTEGLSDVVVGVDDDDATYDKIMGDYPFTWDRAPRAPFLEILNRLAVKHCNEYRWLAFMEDDCKYITKPWESVFIEKLKALGKNGIVWGNDLLNEETLVGLPVLDSSIVQRLGYMAPPEIKYLFGDNFWLDLGKALGSLHYFDSILIDHRHYSTGKRPYDKVALEIHIGTVPDAAGYQSYLASRFQDDVEKLR